MLTYLKNDLLFDLIFRVTNVLDYYNLFFNKLFLIRKAIDLKMLY